MELHVPDTAPLIAYESEIESLPPPPSARQPTALPSVSTIVRDGHRPTYEVFMKSTASRRHPLQDGVQLATLPGGGLLAAVSDATTNARGGVAPEDATWVIMQRLQELIYTVGGVGARPLPIMLQRQLHATLRDWLTTLPGSACGVAQSIAVVGPSGQIQVASIGDTQVLLFKPGRWYRRARLITLNTVTRDPTERKLPSALGQARPGSITLEVAHAHLDVGDLLVMGSDGGLPKADQEDVLAGLATYANDRKRCLATLTALGEALDARARRVGEYDDDRSLLLCERLA